MSGDDQTANRQSEGDLGTGARFVIGRSSFVPVLRELRASAFSRYRGDYEQPCPRWLLGNTSEAQHPITTCLIYRVHAVFTCYIRADRDESPMCMLHLMSEAYAVIMYSHVYDRIQSPRQRLADYLMIKEFLRGR